MVLLSSPNKIWGKSFRGILSNDRTYKKNTQITTTVTSAIFPCFVVNYDFCNFYLNPFNLKFQNKAKNISLGLPSSQIEIRGKPFQRFLRYDRSNKQTEITTLIYYTYVDNGTEILQ